ncbi:hypothetical protein DMB42_11770 [Nonomuraea sp. WAC 01424]|uniref:type II toxin-antitoxin system prevent-host-death family antitoxin n=1 Tax=Nonomuraea sp. WAC 01424 TaxID=2203200 RepID=UPI000F781CA6|nr:type II toxin-antitoxin system prevent-host-death family antitoxin [Nonomuraea sp. WAC 01424]RSN12849.1 hypothetical protein DMB42_11770 [Nonomuraea sp. WAC 01424]
MRERTALYRLYDAADELLYVGITTDTAVRWQAHSTTKWWPQVARKAVQWYATRAEAAAAEIAAIKTERPAHNRAHADYHPPLGTSVRDLRARFADVINDAAAYDTITYVTSRGRRIAAVVSVADAEAIQGYHESRD